MGSSPVLVIICHHVFCKGCHLVSSDYAITQLVNVTPNQRNRFFSNYERIKSLYYEVTKYNTMFLMFAIDLLYIVGFFFCILSVSPPHPPL